MKAAILIFCVLCAGGLGYRAWSEDGHGHGQEHAEEGHEEHEEGEEGHGHEEGGSAIGPEKGILEKGKLGMKLSPEAVQTIDPETMAWQAGAMWIPYAGLVRIREAKFVFRLREGFYLRVPVTVHSRRGEKVSISVPGLETGDQIVTSQAGFLRIAELITEEGASHSHAH